MAHGPFALSGALSYAWQDYDFSRFIPFIGGGGATAPGDTDGNVFAASLEASYDLAARMGIRPDTSPTAPRWTSATTAPSAPMRKATAGMSN